MALIAAHAGDPEQRAIATELCSAWLFAYVDAALCLAEDFYSAERERWVRSTAATRAETIDTILAGGPIDAALASRRLGYELDRQHTAVIAWLQAHEEGYDTHTAMEAAIVQVRERLGGGSALVHPLGILSMAAWISAHDAVSPRQLDDLRFDTRAAPGVRIAIGEPAPGIMGFRQSYNEAAEARRVAELAGRPPGTISRYARVALTAIATADLEQARIFVTARAAEALPAPTISPRGSPPRYARTSTSTPAAAAPPNASASTRTRSATESSRPKRSSDAASTNARWSFASRSRSRTSSAINPADEPCDPCLGHRSNRRPAAGCRNRTSRLVQTIAMPQVVRRSGS